jgi:hypothetical protein
MEFDQFFNYGSAGASNEDMAYQMQAFLRDHWCPQSSVTALFFLTNPARTAHWPRFFEWDHDLQQTRQIIQHFHRAEHEVMRSSVTVSALQHWSDRHRIWDFYFAGWVRYAAWLPGIDIDRIWQGGQETCADWFGASDHNGECLINVANNLYIRPNRAHPNQLGHDLIADKLEAWISARHRINIQGDPNA